MKIGYDGTLRPSSNPGVVSAGGTQVNSGVVRDIANATPETQKLVAGFYEVGKAIAETGEKIRDADYAVDSQRLRLQYAGAMEGVRKELATRNFKDFNEYQAAFSAKEQAARESVIQSATGENGYFRNYNSVWKTRVGQDLDFLRGNAELNAMKTWNQIQIKNHYDGIDQLYKDAVSLGVSGGGAELLKTAVSSDNRINESDKPSFIARNLVLMNASDARKDADSFMRNTFNENIRAGWMQKLATQNNGEEELNKWFDASIGGIDAKWEEYKKKAQRLKEDYCKQLPENQRNAIEKQIDEQVEKLEQDFYENAKTGLRQQRNAMLSESRSLDSREVSDFKNTGTAPTRARAKAYIAWEEAKEAAKASGKSGKEKNALELAQDVVAGKLTESTDDNIARFIDAWNKGSDSQYEYALEDDGTIKVITFPDGATFSSKDYGSRQEYMNACQSKLYTYCMWDAAGLDFSKQDKVSALNQCSRILDVADAFLDKERADNIRTLVDAKIRGINADNTPKDVYNTIVSNIKNDVAQAFDCKKYSDFEKEYPEVAEVFAGVGFRISNCVSGEQARQLAENFRASQLPALVEEATRNRTVSKITRALSGYAITQGANDYVMRLDSVGVDGVAPEQTVIRTEMDAILAKYDEGAERAADEAELKALMSDNVQFDAKRTNMVREYGVKRYWAGILREVSNGEVDEKTASRSDVEEYLKKKREEKLREEAIDEKIKEYGLPNTYKGYYETMYGWLTSIFDGGVSSESSEKRMWARMPKTKQKSILDRPLTLDEKKELVRKYEELEEKKKRFKERAAEKSSRELRIEELEARLSENKKDEA